MAEDRSKQFLRIYKGSVKNIDGAVGAKSATITGVVAGTVVKAGEYQACYVDGVVESPKVDVPAFTVEA